MGNVQVFQHLVRIIYELVILSRMPYDMLHWGRTQFLIKYSIF
jgi:hypothetical protein